MKFDDSLWKAILEDLFADFLRFFFSNADVIFDMKKGFEYLDKEMAQIAVDADPESPKFVDKLVKAYTREGNEQWVLVHVEVQGYTDPYFEERMFTYYYRIFDRYRKRITAIVLLTDRDRKFHPTAYRSEFLGTKIQYEFNTYKVIEQDAEVSKPVIWGCSILSETTSPLQIPKITVNLITKLILSPKKAGTWELLKC